MTVEEGLVPEKEERWNGYICEINRALERFLPEDTICQRPLLDSMRYSLMAGGKRIRPVLLLEFTRVSGGDIEKAMPFACALEMIHTYSLIHDDLPCMDDDSLRRGKPCNHIEYGVATALLAGSALLSAAFETMLNNTEGIPPERALRTAHCIASASGLYGMAGGQQLDMFHEGLPEDLETVALIHRLKTGALLSAAVKAGCILGGADEPQTEKAEIFADLLGQVFQMTDDLLDWEGEPDTVGKSTGTDHAAGKLTYIELLGADECRRRISELTAQAVSCLERFSDRDFLVYLTQALAERKN